MDASITPQELQKSLELRLPLLIVDVRRESVFLAATDILTGALRRDPETIKLYGLTDPALVCLADIVRGADTTRWDFAPQAAGLAALSMGLSRLIPDDHAMLKEGMVIYAALYLWCREDRRSVQP